MMDRGSDMTVPLVRGDIIIVEAQCLVRDALRCLLESWSFSVIGDGKTLTEAVADAPAEARPDLIIYMFGTEEEVERALPDILEARARFAGVKLVTLTVNLQTETLLKATHAGIQAILSKDVSSDVLRRSLELVLLGQNLFPTQLTRMLQTPSAEAATQDAPPVPLLRLPSDRQRAFTLSPREDEILRLLVDGLPNKAIARALNITEATVKVHIKGLLRKMNMANRTQAAVWALSNNLCGEQGVALGGGMAGRLGTDTPQVAVPLLPNDDAVARPESPAQGRRLLDKAHTAGREL